MSNKMSQKDAVYNAVSSVLSENGVTVGDGESHAQHMTREFRSSVTTILVEGFASGSIELEKAFDTDSRLRVYCSGLTSNWLRKDTRLNGGIAYQPKNPGSRVGSGDPQLKALRQLLTAKTEPAAREEIQGFIESRLAEIAVSKTKKVTINFDALPAELRNKYSA